MEQFAGKVASRESEFYAVGVMLHEILMGRRRYRGKTEAEVLRTIDDASSRR